ncbi:MAG: class I SAM-dependent methyltransferase [Pseudomonadota bacterium]
MADNQVLNTVILIEDIDSLSAHEKANALAKRLDLAVHEIKPAHAKSNAANSSTRKKQFSNEQWQLVVTKKGLVLRLSSQPDWGDIHVDFCGNSLAYRRQHGGGKKEPLVKAVGLHKNRDLRILDCTAGMGVDSFIMAAAGGKVTMLERQYHISALLEDALERAKQNKLDLSHRLILKTVDAFDYLQGSPDKYDIIYLDPMFPHKKKSALVKKEMQAFQKLLGEDTDSSKVMTLALSQAHRRVVVKRPNQADPLQNDEKRLPDLATTTKKHRFDIYLTRS